MTTSNYAEGITPGRTPMPKLQQYQMPKGEETRRLGLRIPASLHEELMRIQYETGRSLNLQVIEGMTAYVERYRGAQEKH